VSCLRSPIDPVVEHGHHEDRDVESDGGRNDCYVSVTVRGVGGVHELDVTFLVRHGPMSPSLYVRPHPDPGGPDKGGDRPRGGNLKRGTTGCTTRAIGQGSRHREISIKTGDT